jgi:hypothetical protein
MDTMMTARDLNRRLRGRRIVKIKLNPFDGADRSTGLYGEEKTGVPREMSTNPEIFLDDGTIVRFHVEETNIGDYGVRLILTDADTKADKS